MYEYECKKCGSQSYSSVSQKRCLTKLALIKIAMVRLNLVNWGGT